MTFKQFTLFTFSVKDGLPESHVAKARGFLLAELTVNDEADDASDDESNLATEIVQPSPSIAESPAESDSDHGEVVTNNR